MISKRTSFAVVLFVCFLVNSKLLSQAKDTATVAVSLANEIAPMQPLWAWFGYDEPNYTYMKDGKKLLSELAALSSVPVYVRCHSLMNTGDGVAALKWGSTNMYTEDANGNPIYYWNIVDSIFDTYVSRGMKPLAQLGFMPEALSIHPQPYKHNWKPGDVYNKIEGGWCYPPKDYIKWGNLAYEWVKHCVARYGKKEVETWYWEVWNEPNGSSYWKGTVQEYCKLYDYAVDGVKRALPTAKIGGSDVTGGGEKFQKVFLQHCFSDTNYVTGKIGSPLDVILFHAKGSPRIVNGHVQMGISNQLRNINNGFKLIASFPQAKNIPIVIGESDPEGCAACGMKTNPQNAYRNGTMYSSYTAAVFARKYALADLYKVNLKGAVSWSFEFEDQPWFYGFRDLATNGVDKPVLNVFRMFGMMSGTRVEVSGSNMYRLQTARDSGIKGITTDIGGLASKDKASAAIMLWNYHDDDTIGRVANVQLSISEVPSKKVIITQYQIDDKHSNSYEVWKAMGSPENPTTNQIRTLEKAGQLEQISTNVMVVKDGTINLVIDLPRQAVSFMKLTW